MSLDDYQEPKGAYYTPAIQAEFADRASAEAAIAALRDAGFTHRDIQVQRHPVITVIVSEPTAGMLEEARRILAASSAAKVEPYGADAFE